MVVVESGACGFKLNGIRLSCLPLSFMQACNPAVATDLFFHVTLSVVNGFRFLMAVLLGKDCFWQ